MGSTFSLVDAALYFGLAYLQARVLYGLVVYDDIFSVQSKDTTAQQEKALDHYTTRKSDLFYKVIAVPCLLLVSGVIANAYQQRGSPSSLATLSIAIMTMLNNGKNVVDPVGKLTADAKKDKEDLAKTLNTVTRGHLIDAAGLTAICLCYTFL